MIADAIRSARAAPAVTAFILCILALTISVATVTFSVVDAVVLRPLPFDRPNELVSIEHHRGDRIRSQARARGFGALFFEVQPTHAWVYVIAGGALTAVAVAAALVPARRASRVDPLVALRAE